jgi:N-methylhydantoinase A/oxoprolinase/acetone carboxylase beta subunit
MVNVRLTAAGRLPPIQLVQRRASHTTTTRRRTAWFPGTGSVACAVYLRDALTSGDVLTGPAIIDALDCTAVIPPAWSGMVDAQGFVHLRKDT